MSDISGVSESPASEAASSSKSRRRSHRILRRKRSLLSTINYHLDKALRARNVFRAGFVLLPLAGFLLVSHNNSSLGPNDTETFPVTSERFSVNSDSSMASGSETSAEPRLALGLSHYGSVVEPTDAPASFSMAELADDWSVTDFQSPGGTAEATVAGTINEPTTPGITTRGHSASKTNTYVVNEGGSLWRTGKRFIDDEVLLDKLIDNLSESGMNVRSVRPGVEFVVKDLGSQGMLVVVEEGGDTYESRIVKDSVSSSVRRPSTGDGLPRTASLAR